MQQKSEEKRKNNLPSILIYYDYLFVKKDKNYIIEFNK